MAGVGRSGRDDHNVGTCSNQWRNGHDSVNEIYMYIEAEEGTHQWSGSVASWSVPFT